MLEVDSPSLVMYTELKQFARIGNKDFVRIAFVPGKSYGGCVPYDRALGSDRTYLSRYIVRSEPGAFTASLFRPFDQVAGTLVGRMAKNLGQSSLPLVVQHFNGEGADAMCAALDAFGLDSLLYRNVAAAVMRMDLPSESDRAMLLVMLFVETGCLGDPRQAASDVEEASRQIMGASFRTVQGAAADFVPPEPEEEVNLALARLVGTKMKSGLYPVSRAPQGTVIGSMVTEGDAVVDVDADVSKRHARIWLDGGKWYIQDLNSTNGTHLIRGDDMSECPVSGEPVELFPGDRICLGATTRFMVLDVAF